MRASWPLLDARDWFTDCDPGLRAPVRVTLDGGPDRSIQAAAPVILQWVQEFRQDIFASESFSLADEDHLVLWPDLALWPLPPPVTRTSRTTGSPSAEPSPSGRSMPWDG